jgi:hypothetical protein
MHFFRRALLLSSLLACASQDQEPASTESAIVDPPPADPLGCPGGYCEEDNRGPETVCREGFHVNVYAVCGLTSAACCLPNGPRSQR